MAIAGEPEFNGLLFLAVGPASVSWSSQSRLNMGVVKIGPNQRGENLKSSKRHGTQ